MKYKKALLTAKTEQDIWNGIKMWIADDDDEDVDVFWCDVAQ